MSGMIVKSPNSGISQTLGEGISFHNLERGENNALFPYLAGSVSGSDELISNHLGKFTRMGKFWELLQHL